MHKGNEVFFENIGTFPFVTYQPTKRNNVNRDTMTLKTKPITSTKSEVIRLFLIEKFFPTIKAKWPSEDLEYPIFIQ